MIKTTLQSQLIDEVDKKLLEEIIYLYPKDIPYDYILTNLPNMIKKQPEITAILG